MATQIDYRLRIRNATDTADALVLTSLLGGTNPVITEAPHGDGQEVDPLTGSVRTGSYVVRAADPITSGTTRVITSQLFDANGRQLLLSRRAYVELSTNGGGAWSGLVAGYVMGYRLTTAITWEFSIGDTRRIENTLQVFDGSSPTWAKRGCIFGGPITGGGWGPINDRGGWKFRVDGTPVAAGTGYWVTYQFVSGYRGIADQINTRFKDVLSEASSSFDNWVNQATTSYYSPNVPPFAFQGYPGLVALIAEYAGSPNLGQFTPAAVAGAGQTLSSNIIVQAINAGLHAFSVLWPGTITPPVAGDIHTISLYTKTVSATSPVYLTEHPVDLVTKLWTDANIAYDATAASNLKTLMGDSLRVSMRITKATTLIEFLEKSVFGPFGISARTNTAGVLELFSTRLKLSATPTTIFGTDDLSGADQVLFDNDEATIVSSVRYKTEVYWSWNPAQNQDSSHPLDSVYVAPNEVQVRNGDTSTYSTREVVYEMQGMIHDAAGLVADMVAFAKGAAEEIFDRFGRGAPVGELAVLRPSDTGVQIGDEVYVQPAHLPNLNKRFGDDPSVGARIMQILRRTETPTGPLIKVMDAGSDQQPVTPAAVITIAANSSNLRSVAEFTITNAAAINATAVLMTTVQWSTGASAPSSGGPLFTRYTPGTTPVAAVQLPAVVPGTKVWVRARTEQDGRRPSAWTAWVGVTLTAISLPSALTFSGTLSRSTNFTWVNANATDLTDIYVAPGTVAPADWTPYFVCTVPAATTTKLVGFLDATVPGRHYVGAVQHRDPKTNNVGAFITNTFTLNLIITTIAAPVLGIRPPNASNDSSLPSGIILDITPGDSTYILHIERSAIGGSGAGDWTEIAKVRASDRNYIDYLNSGAVRYYRGFLEMGGGSGSGGYNSLDGIVGTATAIAQLVPANVPLVAINAKTQFGLIGGDVNDMTRAQLALDAAAAMGTYVDFGDTYIPVSSPGLLVAGGGFKFDRVAYGVPGECGFGCAAGAYTAITVTGAPSHLVGSVYGIGGTRPTVNLINLDQVARVQNMKLRAYNADGFLIKIDASYDSVGKFSAEDGGNATYPAFSMNDKNGQVCNAFKIEQLQVEGANKKAIDISGDCINCSIDNIHSEGAIPDAAYPTWILGGGSVTYNNARFAAASNPANAQLWLRGAYSPYLSLRAESIPVVLEGTVATSITLIEPNFTGPVSEFTGQSGKLIIIGGNQATIIANWTGSTARRFFLPDGEVGTFTPGISFGGNTTGITYGTVIGTYKKLGNQVTVYIDVPLTNKGSATGAALITALPFGAAQTAAAVLAFYANITGMSNRAVVCRIDAAAANIGLYWNNSDAAPGAIDNTVFANNSRLILTATYSV